MNLSLEEIIEKVYDIIEEELSSNCHRKDHLEYIQYRLNGGDLSEDDWFISEAKSV